MSQTDADQQRIALAEAWIRQDPDPETIAELSSIVDAVGRGAKLLAGGHFRRIGWHQAAVVPGHPHRWQILAGR